MSELVKTIIEAIQEKKGENIVVADLRKIGGSISSYFIICQGNSTTQVEAIADSISDMCRERLRESPCMWWDWNGHNGWPWTMATPWCTSSCLR